MILTSMADLNGGSPRRLYSPHKPHLWRSTQFGPWFCRNGTGYAMDVDPIKAQRLADWQNQISRMPPSARARSVNPNIALIPLGEPK